MSQVAITRLAGYVSRVATASGTAIEVILGLTHQVTPGAGVRRHGVLRAKTEPVWLGTPIQYFCLRCREAGASSS